MFIVGVEAWYTAAFSSYRVPLTWFFLMVQVPREAELRLVGDKYGVSVCSEGYDDIASSEDGGDKEEVSKPYGQAPVGGGWLLNHALPSSCSGCDPTHTEKQIIRLVTYLHIRECLFRFMIMKPLVNKLCV